MLSSQLAILTKIAYKQKLANMIVLIAFIIVAVFFQQTIDNKEGFSLQGYGNWVYYLGGTGFVLLWIGMSSAPKSNKSDSEIEYLSVSGEINEALVNNSKSAFRLLKAFLKVLDTLGLDYRDYTLSMKKVKEDDPKNAYATGLSRGKRVCVYSNVIESSTDSELEAVIAHEMGHTVNKDMAFLAVLSGISCTFGCIGSFIGLWVAWVNWGFYGALGLFILTSTILPLIQNYASRITEEFADSYAAIHGYGRGLITFLRKIEKESKTPEFTRSHPLASTREEYILRIMNGDQGSIPDNTERNVWQTLLIVAGLIVSLYFAITVSISSAILFASAVGFFISADSFMRTSAGTWHAVFNLTKRSAETPESRKIVTTLLGLALLIGFFLFGIYALHSFMAMTTVGIILPTVSKVMYYLWIAKPITGLIGIKSDFFSLISDFTTFGAVITSIMMIASFFFVF